MAELKDADKSAIEKKEYTLLQNVGSTKSGQPKKKAGSKVKLTDEQASKYKHLKLI